MGQEHAAHLRNQVFAPYRVTKDLMAMADPGALFMHCLPAHRGQEVTDEVIDSPQSVVYRSGGEPAARAKGADAFADARCGKLGVRD